MTNVYTVFLHCTHVHIGTKRLVCRLSTSPNPLYIAAHSWWLTRASSFSLLSLSLCWSRAGWLLLVVVSLRREERGGGWEEEEEEEEGPRETWTT